MSIIDRDTLNKLPRLYSQAGQDNPVLYLKLCTEDEDWSAYLAEGDNLGDDFVVFGLFLGASRSWSQLTVSKLEQGIEEVGLRVHQERKFKATRLKDLAELRSVSEASSNEATR